MPFRGEVVAPRLTIPRVVPHWRRRVADCADEEGTAVGTERSREYNENVRLATMRFAMRDMLKRPPLGMESLVRRHFVLLRPMLERQLARWLDECQSPSSKTAMEKAYVEIMSLVDAAEKQKGHGGGSSSGAAGGDDTMEVS